ncbi:cytochrome P450 [Stachybotrys elegans]|uniref:Cytochrome P450 n=1 Tax=Stachybotrys elegans TaxID=80388 RepID=A0A8K0SJ78_9HYPO|nr:cytochrome P450 [Stachybotrys elegans]
MGLFNYMPTAIAYASAALLTYFALLFAYRVTFHPLSKYPGPFLAKITEAYGGFYAMTMSLHLRTYEDHLKYGPVIRNGPNRLVFNSAQAMKDIYLNDRLFKSHIYNDIRHADLKNSVFDTVDKPTHRWKRKLIGQGVSERSMRIFLPTMLEQIDVFLDLLASSSKTPVNMTDRLKRLGMDLISILALGYPLNTQTEEKNRFMINAHILGEFRGNLFLHFTTIKKLRIYEVLERLAAADVKHYFNTVENMLKTRIEEDKNVRHDLYSLIGDEMNPNKEYSVSSEIWAELGFFFPAGGETTASLLSAAFFYLARHPDVYKKLADEIRSTFATDKEIVPGPKLSGCKYLRACLDETLRISPPVSGTPWRELPADDASGEPLVIDGHVIPPGIEIGVNMYALHHNEEYFPEPFAFRPERWLEGGATEGERKLMQDAWAPFSMGARTCPGRAMANQQATLVMAKTFWSFDFETAPGELGKLGAGRKGLGVGREREGEFQLYEIIAATHDGPMLVFTRREDARGEV